MNRSASHCDPQGSWSTEDDEPSGGTVVGERVTALTFSLVYMKRVYAARTWMGWTRGASRISQ